MTVGFFSPLPPARTGVADYSAALLRGLQRLGDARPNHPCADINLYHLGNNHLHREIYQTALRQPGVIVIHDAVLHHFFLGTLGEPEYVSEFTYNYGPWTSDLARSLWRGRARSATDPRYFRHPMLKRVVEASRAVIVHNPAAGAIVRAHVPNAEIHEIPHLFDPPPPPPGYEVERLRHELGCTGETLLCGVFGHLRESKRLAAILRTVAQLRDVNIRLLVAGQFASTDLARSMESLMAGQGIVCRPYLSEADFWLHAAAVDVCINMRYPAAGETSGIAIRLMGIGKPVIVTRGDETSTFPENACLRVDPGLTEEPMLANYLAWLADDRAARSRIGHAAAAHIRSNHALAAVAEQFWSVLRRCYDK